VTATTPEPKTWGSSRISSTDLNREVRDQIRDLQNRINALTGGGGGSLFPTGAVMAWGGDTVPTGWLLCDGRTLLRNDYLALWNEIGTGYNTGSESGLEFRLPKLNDAIPRTGVSGTPMDGALNTRGVGAGANSLTLTHTGNVSTYTSTTGNQNANHIHDTFAIHAGGAHTQTHNHNINQNTGGHNHNMGHNHNLGVDGVAVNRNTGTTIVAVGHNHSCDAVNVDTTSDGAHSHTFNTLGATNTSTWSAPSTDTGNIAYDFYNLVTPSAVHTHDLTHTHAWAGTHTLNTVPASVSVNWIIKA